MVSCSRERPGDALSQRAAGEGEIEMHTTAPEIQKTRRATAVSQILRAIYDDCAQGPRAWNDTPNAAEYRMLVASDRNTRERAYRLAHRVYLRRGYVQQDARGLCVSNFDLDPETFTLLSED